MENLKIKGNSWIKKEDNLLIVGITEEAVKKAQDFVFIELPKKGPIKEGQVYISLESVKWSGHEPSPVTGEIVEVNDPLFDDPTQINKDPLNAWIMKVKED